MTSHPGEGRADLSVPDPKPTGDGVPAEEGVEGADVSPRLEDNPDEVPNTRAVEPDSGGDPSAASQWDDDER